MAEIEAPAPGESRRQTATPSAYDHRACPRLYGTDCHVPFLLAAASS
jgi:hypothetical protein